MYRDVKRQDQFKLMRECLLKGMRPIEIANALGVDLRTVYSGVGVSDKDWIAPRSLSDIWKGALKLKITVLTRLGIKVVDIAKDLGMTHGRVSQLKHADIPMAGNPPIVVRLKESVGEIQPGEYHVIYSESAPDFVMLVDKGAGNTFHIAIETVAGKVEI